MMCWCYNLFSGTYFGESLFSSCFMLFPVLILIFTLSHPLQSLIIHTCSYSVITLVLSLSHHSPFYLKLPWSPPWCWLSVLVSCLMSRSSLCSLHSLLVLLWSQIVYCKCICCHVNLLFSFCYNKYVSLTVIDGGNRRASTWSIISKVRQQSSNCGHIQKCVNQALQHVCVIWLNIMHSLEIIWATFVPAEKTPGQVCTYVHQNKSFCCENSSRGRILCPDLRRKQNALKKRISIPHLQIIFKMSQDKDKHSVNKLKERERGRKEHQDSLSLKGSCSQPGQMNREVLT